MPPDAAVWSFSLPFPPSVNRYYRHVGSRTLISREGRSYRQRVCAQLREWDRPPLVFPLVAELHLYPPDARVRDIDNFHKSVWDSLQHAGVYRNDCQIRRCVTELYEPDGTPRAIVILRERT